LANYGRQQTGMTLCDRGGSRDGVKLPIGFSWKFYRRCIFGKGRTG